jgi:conjugative transfer signal peptidase TraF
MDVVRRGLRLAAMLAMPMLGLALLGWALGLRVNLTPSLPLGLYHRSAEGGLVEFCPPAEAGALAAARGYRARGVCPDRHVPLIKPVIARAGDEVGIDLRGIRVNGRALPNTQAHRFDHQGRPLVPWPAGRYRVAEGTLWVASSWNDGSFDSRYFGPIPTDTVRARLAPLWTVE